MSSRTVVYFSAPAEQKSWIKDMLLDDSHWCVYRLWDSHSFVDISRENIESSGIGERQGDLFIGTAGRMPIWRWTASGRREIDAARSMAIQVIPSFLLSKLLLSGQIGIMKESHYDGSKEDYLSLMRLFKYMVKSLKQYNTCGAAVGIKSRDGQMKILPHEIVTDGAKQLWKIGVQLKQYVDGSVVFEVVDSAK